MRIRKSIVILSGMVFMLTYLLSGCSKPLEKQETEKEEVISIPVTFLINPATNLSENQELVSGFNEQYQGTYEVDVEWLTESASGYRENLKKWNVLDEMPVIITDAGFDYDFYRLLVENKRLVNLRPYLNAIPEWKASIKPEILTDCTEDSGDIYLAPLGNEIKSYAGIIYNKELLKQAGYETFPQTWEEFWKCLNTLRGQGITPLSLHGSGSYWVSMLFATSYICGTADGREFLNQDFPESYQNSVMENLMAMMDQMYDYTFEDAVEIDYDEAEERFCDGKAAIFANGYWMIEQLPDEVKEKLQFAPFPGNILMSSPRMSAWAMTVGYDAKVTDGAAKLLAFRVQQDLENTQRLMNQEDLSPVEDSYINAVKKNATVMPNYQMKWEQEIQNDFFTENLPGYLEGEVSSDELLGKMDERLVEIQKKK